MDEMPPSAPSYPDGRQHRAIQQRPRTLLAISWTHVSQYRPAGAAARGNSANPARSSRSFPGGTACPLMAIPRGTCSPRTINAGPEVPAMRRPPAHRRGTKTGQLRAGRWPIQWDRGRFQSLWFWKPSESPSFPVPSCLLPSVVSSWHGPDAPLASTVDLVAMQVPNFSDYHKHLPGRNGGEEGIGTNNGHLGDRAQLRLSEKGEGSMVGCPFGAGPTPPFASMHASHRNCQSPLRFASEKYWAATLLGNNELSATGALERAGPSHRVKGTSQDPPADINRHAVIPDLARFHAPGQFFLLFEVQQRKTTWTRNVHWVSNLADTVSRLS